MANNSVQSRFEKIRLFFLSVYQMLQLAHEASPRRFWLMIVLQIFSGIHPIITAIITKLIFDILGQILSDTSSVNFAEQVLPLLILQAVVLLLIQVVNGLSAYTNEYIGLELSVYAQEKAFAHLLTLKGLQQFESSEFHDMMDMAVGQIRYAPHQILNSIGLVLTNSIQVIGFIGVLLLFSQPISALLIALAAIMLIVRLRAVQRRHEVAWSNSTNQRMSYYFSLLFTNTYFSRELRLFNIGQYFLKRFRDVSNEINLQKFVIMKRERWEMLLVDAGYALILLMAWVIVLLRAFARQISLGDVTLYLEALRAVQSSLFAMMTTIAELNERAEFFAHYRDLMQTSSSVPVLAPVQAVPPLREAIEIRNLSFRYSETGDEILKNINLTLKKGESTALVGINGAGKSTLVKLLARFYDPCEGQILWDGIDIRHFNPDELRKHIGVVLQDFVQYQATARENIGLGDVQHIDNPDKIQRSAEDVGIHKFISELPRGYETVLSRWLIAGDKKGTDLSGGQWQKIAIARSYLRQGDLLMLDEPTAALDAEAESDIYRNFAELTNEKASLLISHRFSTVRMADKVAVIEDGCITEYGTHAELIARNQTYARLYNLQAQQYAG